MIPLTRATTCVALAAVMASAQAFADQAANLAHTVQPDARRIALPAMPAPETEASVLPQMTTLSPPVTLTYSGSSNALTVTDSGTGRGISSTVTNTNSGSSALYGSTVGSGAGLTGFNGGTGGPGGKFQITNANSAQAGVFATTIGSGPAVLGTLTTQAAQYGQAAIMGVNSGGSSANSGSFGNAGQFLITNTNNYDAVLVATTQSDAGIAMDANDYSQGGGTGVYAYSNAGFSAYFISGSGGVGSCSYDGGNGFNCPGSSSNVTGALKSTALNQVLVNLDRMPVAYYQMDGQRDGARHLGPSAQDFRNAFNLGNGRGSISTGDAEGVALTAAKGLYHKLQIDEAMLAADREQIAADHEHIAELEHRLKSQEVSLEAATARLEATIAQLSASLSAKSGTLAKR